MQQPLSRPTTIAQVEGPRSPRTPTGRVPARPVGAPAFSQVLASAARPAQPGALATDRPLWDGLLLPSPMGPAGAPGSIDPMGMLPASEIADPVGLAATASTARLAALSATQRSVVFAGTGPRSAAITSQGIGPAGALGAQAPSKAQIEGFMRSIKGFDQTRASEYDSPAQARTWGYSTCSAASLTAVLRAAGQDVKIADVMKAMPNGLTVELGLVSRPALVNAANSFGAKATDDVTSYEKLRAATESGQPVLVDYRDAKFPQGHFVVVTGVTEEGVQVADSSRYDLTFIPRGQFMRSWSGKGIRVDGLTPTTGPGPSQPNRAQPGAPATRTA